MVTHQTVKGGKNLYKIDLTNKDPIYQQIVDQTKRAITLGYFKENDQMPSVRELARTLLVNQSTITRAYKELENLGIIQTLPGKGTFILLDERKIKWEQENIEEKLKEVILECKFFKINEDQVHRIVENIYEGGKDL